ncbi:putative abortive infection phage resistance protein [Geomonas silvestris]|uniref:Putative abortive infection phage resistance protein n=1 Tax=Geomonas silvestris TaxID=2740184 RepID=A0A6V8MGY2_9BACT|nr:AIPR family protein [Geomonas silvestris]GFO59222.1 putative abortive infection phage resistance protein [Geomonas silvestris]
MSVLHVNQISRKIKELFADKIDITDLSSNDKEIESKILTRCLAAYSIYHMAATNEVDAANSVVDGGDDNGIDAIYYSPSNKKMLISQSKWNKSGTGEPSSADVVKFCNGVRDLFNLDFERFNLKIQDKRAIIEKALTEYDTTYELLVIHTGNQNFSMHSMRNIEDLLKEMNDAGDAESDDLVNFTQMNQGAIHVSLASGLEGEHINIEVGLTQWGKLSEPHNAYFGMVAGEEVAKWWCDHGKRLFAKNIRNVLGSTNVNDEIKHTIESTPESFWYFNNGITMVANSIRKSMVGGSSRDIGSFKADGVYVVNGAQTVSTIGRYFEQGGANLDKVRVHLRIVSLENSDEHFGAKVTKSNNRQNRIENRDFVSQDEEQIRLRTELAIEGIEYNIVRSESFKPSDKSFDLQEATVALSCASEQSALAVQAKREIGKFFEDLTKAPYKSIFNPQTNGIYLYNCINIIREVDKCLNEEILKLEKKSGKRYGVMVHGNRIIALVVLKKLNISKIAQVSSYAINKSLINSTTIDAINKTVEVTENMYKGNLLGTLFKNASKCKLIYENCI